MLLPRLLDALAERRVSGPSEIDVVEIAYDSRRVTPGCLFVSVPRVGESRSNQDHIEEAIRRGAASVVAQGVPPAPGVTSIAVPDARAALADLADVFFGHPSRELSLFAVTGTDGKTTTTYLLEQVLAHAGLSTGLIGTVEIKVGEERWRNLDRMTTPESLDLQRLLRRMVQAGVTHVALEASSHALAVQRLRRCSFAACAVTNIAADHVEFHGSWERYFLAKSSLFTELAPDRPAILNRDDAQYARLRELIRGPVLTYGIEGDAQVQARGIEQDEAGVHFVLQVGGEEVPVRLGLPGTFNVSNALAAAALAWTAGLAPRLIAQGLSGAKPPPGRLQRVNDGQPFEVLVDYAHTMQAFRSVLATLRARTRPPRRLIVVFGATGDRDRAKRPELARIARTYADFCVITNEDPYGEDVETIVDEIVAGLPDEDQGAFFVRETDRGRAVRLAIERAQPGDTVVVLGKGHEQSMVVDGRKVPWSDEAAVRAALAELP